MSASTWGNPNASKRVLLLHGLTSSSNFWHRIAPEFASRGYFVTAPDILGHGMARRGSDYSIAALADELRSLFIGNDHSYDIVVGHSLGGVIAAALSPLLKSTQPVRVVLVDPPLEQTPEQVGLRKILYHRRLEDLKSPQDYQKTWPHSSNEDAIFGWLSTHLCDPSAIDAIVSQNIPWSFSHLLSTAPDNVKITVLAADPSKGACVKEEELKAYPHVASKTIWDASHLIPIDAPQVVIETALESTEL